MKHETLKECDGAPLEVALLHFFMLRGDGTWKSMRGAERLANELNKGAIS